MLVLRGNFDIQKMETQILALLIDEDYRHKKASSPSELAATTNHLRRILEDHFSCTQVGPGLFAFDESEKEKAFNAVDNIEWDGGNKGMTFKFIKFEALDSEFQSWRDRHYEALAHDCIN